MIKLKCSEEEFKEHLRAALMKHNIICSDQEVCDSRCMLYDITKEEDIPGYSFLCGSRYVIKHMEKLIDKGEN